MSKPQIVITNTDRLLLCAPSIEHIGCAEFAFWSDPETMKYIGAGYPMDTRTDRPNASNAR